MWERPVHPAYDVGLQKQKGSWEWGRLALCSTGAWGADLDSCLRFTA